MSNRRKFLHQSILGISGTALLPILGKAAVASNAVLNKEKNNPLQMGIAGYTFKSFSIDQSIAMMKRVGVKNLSLKDC